MNDDGTRPAASESLRGHLEVAVRAARAQHAEWSRHEALRSWARLLSFAVIVAPWLVRISTPEVSLAISAGGIVAMFLAVRSHRAAVAIRDRAARDVLVLEEAQRRCGGAVVCLRSAARPEDDAAVDALLPRLREEGPHWALSEQERDDLDFYSRDSSLFGLLNRTSTAPGARRLRDWLEHPLLDRDAIGRRQERIARLADDPTARAALMSGLAALRSENTRLPRALRAFAETQPLRLHLPYGVLAAWSLAGGLVLAASVGAAVAGGPTTGGFAGLVLAVNLAVTIVLRGRLRDVQAHWSETGWVLRALDTAVRAAARDMPEEAHLAPLKAPLERLEHERVLTRLAWRAGWTESGGWVQFLLNVLALADVHVGASIAALASSQRSDLLAGAAALFELDALCSLACFSSEQPVACRPRFADGELLIRDGRHPLVDPLRVVGNDLLLTRERRVWVITGSNMAGKSTFLRMVGVNVLLAQVGCNACACEMILPPTRPITDLSVRDSLSSSESYFLAEVRHLRRLVLPPPGEAPLLGLIDEPFRGTNSEEQTAASVAVLRHLLRSPPHLFLVATHDRALTGLADGRSARNVHFEENLSDGGMVFDYRLREGPATTRNALRVLEREGYPPELLDAAEKWVHQRGIMSSGS